MDTTLDDDFVNFEVVSRNCVSPPLNSGAEEELSILDNEARQRERKYQCVSKAEKNKNFQHVVSSSNDLYDKLEWKMKSPDMRVNLNVESTSLMSEDHLFTTFSYNPANKRLTMIPIKYKIKEERRKVLKISVNKLKKIDDPESWLCRSVLINNTIKKLQKEARDEKINKQMSSVTYSKNQSCKTTESDNFELQINSCVNINININNNNNHNNNNSNKVHSNNNNNSSSSSSSSSSGSSDNSSNSNNNKDITNDKINCFESLKGEAKQGTHSFYQKDVREGDYKLSNRRSEKILNELHKESVIESEGKVKFVEKECHSESTRESQKEPNLPTTRQMATNLDFSEKSPSIKRCASRKKSFDEDGIPNEILNLKDAELVLDSGESRERVDVEDVDVCDVHDVLSQLYMPPTPRMLTSIDSDTDDDELNVVDIDSSYIDSMKNDGPKLPSDSLFENGLLFSDNVGVKRVCEEETDGNSAKRRKLDDVFSCFSLCGESYDNFLYSNSSRNREAERTGMDVRKDSTREGDLIELQDEEDIKRRLSHSLSSHYNRKSDKACDNFFEDNCDNQYSCGHTVTMFSDMQSITFHNLIASLET